MNNLSFVPSIAESMEEYKSLVNSIKNHRLPAAVTGLAAIHKNHFTAALSRTLKRKILFIAADESEAVRLCDDLGKMGLRACFCPARDIELRPLAGRSHEYERSRIETLSRIVKEEFDVAVVCADGASQLTVPPEELQERMITIAARRILRTPSAPISGATRWTRCNTSILTPSAAWSRWRKFICSPPPS